MPVGRQKSRSRIIATLLAHAALRKSGIVKTQIRGEERYRPSLDRVSSDLESAVATFQAYLHKLDLHQLGAAVDSLAGARILEIGPGASVAVALQFVAAGARQAVCLDRFVPQQFTEYHAELYRRLRERLPPEQLARFDGAVDLTARQLNPERLAYVYGEFAALCPLVQAESIDLIVSNAAIEEIYDLEAAIDVMCALLRAGGRMVHKIDFRDYSLFSNYGYSPLEFLTIPDWIYRPMAESTGQPNRKLIDAYRAKFRELGYPTRFQELTFYNLNESEIRAIRPRLLPRFRELPGEDFLTESAYLVARKT